jgi:FG-GAP repeat
MVISRNLEGRGARSVRRRATAGAAIALLSLAVSTWPAAAGGSPALFFIPQATLTLGIGAQQLDHFGSAVAISGDDSTALMGADGAHSYHGAAYVFFLEGAWWVGPLELGLHPADQAALYAFGEAAALNADGSVALVSATGNGRRGVGAVFVFTRSNGIWGGPVKLTTPDLATHGYGSSIGLSSDGKTALVGDSGGNAYVFAQNGGIWGAAVKLSLGGPPATAGSISLSGDAKTALVGAGDATVNGKADAGVADVFTLSAGNWQGPNTISLGANAAANGRFGYSVSLDGAGDRAVIGTDGVGAYSVSRSNGPWSAPGALPLGGAAAGYAVGISGNGANAVIGGDNAIYPLFQLGGVWDAALYAKPQLPPSSFGSAISLSSDAQLTLVGANSTTLPPNSKYAAGAAYVFFGSDRFIFRPGPQIRRCPGCTLLVWRSPRQIRQFLAGYHVYSRKKLLTRTLVASETNRFRFEIKGKFKHLRVAPVLGTPPACITGGSFSDTFDRSIGDKWNRHVPVDGPAFSVTAKDGCLELTVPDSGIFDSSSVTDNAPELLRNASSMKPWTATTRVTLSDANGSGGFLTGMVLRFPQPAGGGLPLQLQWGLYRAGLGDSVSLRLEDTSGNDLADVSGVPNTMEVRIAYDPTTCDYRFSYSYPGQRKPTDSGYSYAACDQAPQVGLMTKTFNSPVSVTTDFDWFNLTK